MKRMALVLITVPLVLATIAEGTELVRRGGSDRVLPQGVAVAALRPVGSEVGWGRVVVTDLTNTHGLSVEARLQGLDPDTGYALCLDGRPVAEIRTGRFGEAQLSLDLVSPTGSTLRGLAEARELSETTVVDRSLATVLEGAFELTLDDVPSTVVYEAFTELDDMGGNGARGMARVERREDGTEVLESWATGLAAGISYQVLADSIPVGLVTADRLGQGGLQLAAPALDDVLPADLQPVEEIRAIEWIDLEGRLVLAGFLSVDTLPSDVLHGLVESLADGSFELTVDPETRITVILDPETMWGGSLVGPDDLEVGMTVQVEGELREDESFHARLVADDPMLPPVDMVDGVVVEVSRSSFVVECGPGGEIATVTVDAETQWPGPVTGIGELEPGMWVHVEGEVGDDGAVHAFVVMTDPGPGPVVEVLVGTVQSVSGGGFALEAGPEGTITVSVAADTLWAGTLGGLADLEVGMAVLVEGERLAEGSLRAWLVTDELMPPQPGLVDGIVQSVSTTSFVVGHDPAGADGVVVTVDANTDWVGPVTGIGELEPGMWVHVEGEVGDDGAVHAFVVMTDPGPGPVVEVLVGTVQSVSGGGFALEAGPEGTITVSVAADTLWAGTLGGLADLEVGMAVLVEGERLAEGSLRAWLVTDELMPPQPGLVDGIVQSVSTTSFVVGHDPAGADGVVVTVDANTDWVGPVTGIGELEPGMWVHVEGEVGDDGAVHAFVVMTDTGPGVPPMLLIGSVAAVDTAGFEMTTEIGETVTVVVDEHTAWGGQLTGIGDLEVGLRVLVEGELAGDGTVVAVAVMDDRPPVPRDFVDGLVISVSSSSFVVSPDPDGLEGTTVTVDDHTAWQGSLTGIDGLAVGTWVHAEGELGADGSLLADVVMDLP